MKKNLVAGKTVFVVVTIVIVAAIVLFAAQHGLEVETVTVKPQTISDFITEKGVMETGTLCSQVARVSGTVQEVCVKENQAVKAGDVLLRIDPIDLQQERAIQQSILEGYQAQLQQVKLKSIVTEAPSEYLVVLQEQVEICSSNYDTAERLYRGHQELYQLGGISAMELESSKTAWLAAREELMQAQQRYENSSQQLQILTQQGISQTRLNEAFYDSMLQQAQSMVDGQEQVLQQLERSLQHCTITAAEDGVVVQLPAEKATAVQAGQTVAVLLGEQKEMMAAFEILTTEAPLLQVGEPVTITVQLRSGDVIFPGVIAQIYDYAQTGVSALGLEEHRVKVLVAVTDAADTLKNGYEVQGTFQLYRQDQILAVPNSALYQVDDAWYVFMLQHGRAVQTPVEIGYQAAIVTEIRAGLQQGDVVIQNASVEGLQDGVKVKKHQEGSL